MSINLDNHPCFNDKARHLYGRVHLPVAPRCNIQCNFCNRKFDCVNESRPGVASTILTPFEALDYLNELIKKNRNLSVIGIAGPGDPFANPDETMQTLRLVRERFPEKIICVSTNGLNILPYIDELAELNISHVTLTVNAVDQDIGARIYAWVRYQGRIKNNVDGAWILLKKQLLAIKRLKEKGIIVKINSIVIPGINDHHIVEIAKKMAELGVDILNCIPFLNNKECNFSYIKEPPSIFMTKIRTKAGKYVKQMNHCTRCRADAVGILGEEMDKSKFDRLQKAREVFRNQEGKNTFIKGRPYVAVASIEGLLINKHLGEAEEFLIFEKKENVISQKEIRKAPLPGGKNDRWKELAGILSDCSYVLVNGVGTNPRIILENSGIKILLLEGLIDEALRGIFMNESILHLMKRKPIVCGQACSGSGNGCG